MNEFDLKAAEWDQNPIVWERAEAISKEIKSNIPLNKQMSALEFGAGTGIASFILKDYLKDITLMDSSVEMIRIMDKKISKSGTENLRTVHFNLELEDFRERKFDLIFNQMVLHHISDIENIILKFFNLLNPGGFVAIADIYSEDGSFHGEGFTGHNGFDPSELSELLLRSGFKNINHHKFFVINKIISEGVTKDFDVFLIVAQRA